MGELEKIIFWHALEVEEVEKISSSDIKSGLDVEEVNFRREKYGLNEFEKGHKKTILDHIWVQLKSPLVLILIAAGLATFFLGEYVDLLVIAIALLINVVAGVFQESRASQAFEALMKGQEKHATVIRDGVKKMIPVKEIVVGDMVVIEPGSYVPADIRIVEGNDVSVNEAALTGEWIAVPKDVAVVAETARITDRFNMLWMGTLITTGTGKGIVVAIGNETQLGMIAEDLVGEEELIPLQVSIKRLAKYLSILVILVVILIFVGGIWRGHEMYEMILTAIAIAVAVMPEGLPAAVTVVLALGMETILKKGGLVRNLLAAETLGNTTVILTDKTGTLTRAEMRVADVYTEKAIPDHGMTAKQGLRDSFVKNDKKDILTMALMTADAYVEGAEDALGEWTVRGNPVERAVVLASLESGLRKEELLELQPQLDTMPFESMKRISASLHRIGGPRSKKRRVYMTGAPEIFLENAVFIYSGGVKKKIPQYVRKALFDIQDQESAAGMRMIGVGYVDVAWNVFPHDVKGESIKKLVKDMVFCGLISLHDPIRKEVPEAIKIAGEAGTNVIMMTGDNPVTALKIAQTAGIAREHEIAYTGADIEQMSDKELYIALDTSHVFARVLPKQKLRISRLLKAKGEVVAMTGDGINDAPALRNADIGIALGSGTEVAKEAADLILLNDSFSIIIDAIKEGRRIRDNLKKIITYLIATSFSELLIVGVSIALGTPLPILASQILWINIIEEGFMNFAFAFEPPEPDVMKRDPRDDSMQRLITPNIIKLIAVIAVTTGVLLVSIYFYLLHVEMPIEQIRTIIFIALSIDSIFFTFSVKNIHLPIWEIDLFNNKYLIFAFLGSVFALFLSLQLPMLRNMLSLQVLSLKGLALMLLLGVINLVIIESAKYFVFKKRV